MQWTLELHVVARLAGVNDELRMLLPFSLSCLCSRSRVPLCTGVRGLLRAIIRPPVTGDGRRETAGSMNAHPQGPATAPGLQKGAKKTCSAVFQGGFPEVGLDQRPSLTGCADFRCPWQWGEMAVLPQSDLRSTLSNFWILAIS